MSRSLPVPDDPYNARHFLFEEAPQDCEYTAGRNLEHDRYRCLTCSCLIARPRVRFANEESPKRGMPQVQVQNQNPSAPQSVKYTRRPRSEWCGVLGACILLVVVVALFFPDFSVATIHLRGDALLRFQPFGHPLGYRVPTDGTIPPNIMEYVHTVVSNTLLAHIGRPDYALASDGTLIVPALTTSTAMSKQTTTHPAAVVLRDNMHGGRCWRIPGKVGQVGISLSELIYPTHFSIDHLPINIAPLVGVEIGEAPRTIRVWGAIDGRPNEELYTRYIQENPDFVDIHRPGPALTGGPPLTTTNKFVLLAEVEYDIHARLFSQTFVVNDDARASKLMFGVFVFEILDNWGGDMTCVYRLRIHGHT